MLQQGQSFWRGHDLDAREVLIKASKQHWADSYREQRRQALKATRATRKQNVRYPFDDTQHKSCLAGIS